MTLKGAYVLTIELKRPLELETGRFAGRVLTPGFYAYCGSAKGPGGLQARVGRHLAPDKKIHWHVDALTLAGEICQVGVKAGGSECDLVARVLATPGASVPIREFGSSDCPSCEAHLVQVDRSFSVSALGLDPDWHERG